MAPRSPGRADWDWASTAVVLQSGLRTVKGAAVLSLVELIVVVKEEAPTPKQSLTWLVAALLTASIASE